MWFYNFLKYYLHSLPYIVYMSNKFFSAWLTLYSSLNTGNTYFPACFLKKIFPETWNELWLRILDVHTLNLLSMAKDWKDLFLSIDFREMRSSYLPSRFGCSLPRGRGLYWMTLQGPPQHCDQMPWTETGCPIPREGIKYLYISFFSSNDLVFFYVKY